MQWPAGSMRRRIRLVILDIYPFCASQGEMLGCRNALFFFSPMRIQLDKYLDING